MPSTITEPVTARLKLADHEALRVVAHREGTTVSALISRLVATAVPRLTGK